MQSPRALETGLLAVAEGPGPRREHYSCQPKKPRLRVPQERRWAEDRHFATGFRRRKPAGSESQQISPQAGEKAGAVGQGRRKQLDTPFPRRPPFHPEGLEEAGWEWLGCRNENIKRTVPDKRQSNRH